MQMKIAAFLEQHGDNIQSVASYLWGQPETGPEFDPGEYPETLRDVAFLAFKTVYLWEEIRKFSFEGINEESLKDEIEAYMQDHYGFVCREDCA